MSIWMTLVDWLTPSLVGFVAGYVTCLAVGRVVADQDSPVPTNRRRAEIARTIFGVVLLLMGTVTLARGYYSTACIRDAIEARSMAQGTETRAQIALFEAILNSDPADNRAAQIEYLEAARALERTRAENTLECR